MGILTIVILLTISVLVHEWGHYIVMRRNGLKVDIFAIGFGPVLWRRKLKSGAVFRICLIPLGGYVKGPTEGEGSLDLNTYYPLMAAHDRDISYSIKSSPRQEAMPCLWKQQHEKGEALLFP